LSAASKSGSLSAATFTRYCTSGWRRQIEPVECTRDTGKSVWVLERPFSMFKAEKQRPPVERRRAKVPDFHDTWEEAHAYLLGRAEVALVAARRSLQIAQDAYGNVKGMKRPNVDAADQDVAEALRQDEQTQTAGGVQTQGERR
jgi:hypothetical protein